MAATSVAIRGISGRGFRVPNAAGDIKTVKEGVAILVDFTDEATRTILSRERDNFVVVTNTGTTTAYLAGLSRRGFRVNQNATATLKQVKQDGVGIQVGLNHGATKRTLKRQKRDFIRVPPSGTATLIDIFGLQESQASFRVKDPVLVLNSAAANSDLTFVPKVSGGENISVALVDLGVDNATEDVSVTSRAIQVSLAVTQGVAASAVLTQTANAPAASDSVTVNDRTYVFDATLDAAYDVKLEATADATMDHLIKAINGTGTAGVDYFAGTLPATGVTAGARVGTGNGASTTITANAEGTAGNAFAKAETGGELDFDGAGATFTGGVDYDLSSTAAGVVAAIEAHTGAGEGFAANLVTVTDEGNGSGEVDLFAATVLGADPEPLAKGETVTVDISDPFNVAQLRRHYRAWVEVL